MKASNLSVSNVRQFLHSKPSYTKFTLATRKFPVRAFLTMITRKSQPKKFRVDKGTEFAGEFKYFCKAEGIQLYSTVSETEAAFADRRIWSKIFLYRHMGDYGYNFIHNLSQFIITPNSRQSCSTALIPKNIRNSDFLSILYSKPPWEYKKPKFKFGDRVCISKYDLPLRKCFKLQFIQEVFEIVAFSSRKPPTYTIKR